MVTKVGEHRFIRAAAGNAPELEFTLVTDAAGRVTHLLSKGRASKRVD